MSRIYDVMPEQLPRFWTQVEPHLQKAIQRGQLLFEPLDVFVAVAQGKAKLWVSQADDNKTIEAALVSKLMDYPLGRTCCVYLIGGTNLNGWKDKFIEMIESYARANHCREMESGGRRGWSRVAGYEECGVMFRKKL